MLGSSLDATGSPNCTLYSGIVAAARRSSLGTLGRDRAIGLLAARITSQMKAAAGSDIGASCLLAGDAVAVPI